jgi:membrane dipeptidase
MDRRQLIKAGLALPLAGVGARAAPAKTPIYIGDMHYHLFFQGRAPAASNPLARNMAEGNATLVAWSLVGDLLWMGASPRGFVQKSVPKPGEPEAWFKRELARIKNHLAEQNLKIALTPADIDAAVKGEPRVVLSVEGASFLDDGMGRLQAAYDEGVRHIQLVHYIRNTIGDFQTENPVHAGLSAAGKKVVEECNRLGILVDLAHCAPQAVAQALEISKTPVVWSHSSVTRARKPDWTFPAWQARQLSLEGARALAAKGGVVGLWALRIDVGPSIAAYGDRLAEMAEWLGEDHVAFGTDMNGLLGPVLSNYADVRRVVEHWERRGMSEARMRKLAIENYARVLRTAMAGRQA